MEKLLRWSGRTSYSYNGTDDGFTKHIAESRWRGNGLVPSVEALNDRVLFPDAISPCDGHKLNSLRGIGGSHVGIEFPKGLLKKLGHAASLLCEKG